MRKNLWDSRGAAEATGGRNTKDWVASGVSIDTRTLKKGDLFIAISDSRDGHDFVADAFKLGASAAMVSYVPKNICSTDSLLIVSNVKLALEALAVFRRKYFKGKVIAITGSVGKTGSKDMLALVLSNFGVVSKAEKSFNNHLGVPLTLARAPLDNNFLIVEIGMNNKKEIAPLSKLVRPDITMITDVSEAHLASFKSTREIAKEKSDICVGLSESGSCVVSRDVDNYSSLSRYIKKFGVNLISFGKNKSATYRLKKTVIKNNKTCATATLQNGLEFFFKINSPGTHHASNALGIIAILELLGIDATHGVFELSNWHPGTGRGLVINIECNRRYAARGFTIIDETYNANPKSMVAAFDTLANFSSINAEADYAYRARRIAIIGDMLELGSDKNKLHAELAERLDFDQIDVVHCIGTAMKFFYKNLPESKRGRWVSTVKELSENIVDLIKDKDIIMLKASNGVGFNSLLGKLKAMGKSG